MCFYSCSTSLEVLGTYLTLRIYLATRHYGHVAAIRILILTNCYGITKIYFHWKSDLLTKFLYYENLEPHGTIADKLAQPILCASYFMHAPLENAHDGLVHQAVTANNWYIASYVLEMLPCI